MKNKFFKKFTFFILSFSISLNQNFSYANSNEKTIAISEFNNNTGIETFDNLKIGLADSLTNRLAVYKSFSIIERSKLQEALKELTLSQSGFVSNDSVIKLGELLGARYILFGAILKSGELYQVSLRLMETNTGKVILGQSVECSTQENIINSINYLALKTAQELGEVIDINKLEQAKHDINKNYSVEKKSFDFTWLYVSSSIVIVAGIIGGVIASKNFFDTTLND